MFKIVSNNEVVGKHQALKEISKPSARKILKEKIGGLIAEAGEGITAFNIKDSWWKGRVDVQAAIEESKRYVKDYERTLPEKLNPEIENQMWKKAKQLKDEFTFGMLSKDELHPVKEFMVDGTIKIVVDNDRIKAIGSVEREYAWQQRNQKKIEEFKNLMRHLDPDNPNAGDIERYRPKRSAK